jgi:hypothetical protein
MPEEAGYVELRRVFEYLKEQGIVGGEDGVKITVVDADDLLDHPAEVIERFCGDVGIDYTPEMLKWEDEESQQHASDAFEKWNGFHNDVLGSTGLKPREHGVVSEPLAHITRLTNKLTGSRRRRPKSRRMRSGRRNTVKRAPISFARR